MIKIKILTPAFNCEEEIETTIYSVFGQTFKNWELLVIDDVSTDNTGQKVLDMAKSCGYEDRVFVKRREEKYGEVELLLDQELINVVAKDCSVGAAKCKQTLRGIRAFEHFKANWEHALPKGEEFTGSPGDYYAFQKIMTSPFVREQFGIKSDADLTLSQEGEKALFTWMFKNPHNNLTAEHNTNLWPAARATDEWNKLHAYDIANGTHFAASYDVSDPEAATERMDVLMNKMGLHQNQVEPIDLVDDLIRQLKAIPNESFEKQGANLQDSLEDLDKWVKNTKKRLLGGK